MKLFYNLNEIFDINNVEIKTHNNFEYKKINLDKDLYSQNNAGFPNITIKNNEPYFICKNGLYKFDCNKLEFNQLTEKCKVDTAGMSRTRDIITFDSKTKKYLKHTHSNLCYESIFIDYHKKPPKIKFQNKEYEFNYRLLKEYKINYYNNNYKFIEQNCLTYVYKLDNTIIEWNYQIDDWCLSDLDIISYENLDDKVTFNNMVKKLMMINKEVHKIIPSKWTLTKYIRKNNDKFFNFDHIDKFGCDVTYRNCMELKQSSDLMKWEHKSYLSECYNELFKSGSSLEILHTVPISDAYTCLFYDNYHEKYFLFNRMNVDIGCRYIMKSESDDLINWTNYEVIKTNPKFGYEKHENYYFPSMMKYNNTKYTFGLLNHLNTKTNILTENVFISENNIDFDFINMVKTNTVNITEGKNFHYNENNFLFIPNAFYVNDKFNFFYITHTHEENFRNLNLMSLRKDGFSSIYSKEGSFSIMLKGDIKINYKSNNLIRVKIYDKSELKFDENIFGDELEWDLYKCDKFLRFDFYLLDSQIFSLTGEVGSSPGLQLTNSQLKDKNKQKYNTIEFMYLEHTNTLNEKLRDTKNNNRWRKRILPFEFDKIIGQPIYKDNMTKVYLRFKNDDKTFEYLLIDNSNIDEHEKYKDLIPNPYMKKGTSCVICDIRPLTEKV